MSVDTSAGMQAALLVAARNYRRALIIAVGLGVASLLALSLLGQFVAGVLICIGLGLGAFNSKLVQRALVGFVGDDTPSKRKLMLGVLRRLLIVSVIAFGIALLYRPVGWVVLLGLAVFQILVMGSVFGGLLREVRRA